MKSNWIVCSTEWRGKPHPFLFTSCALFIFTPQNGGSLHTGIGWTFTQQLNRWLIVAPECVLYVLLKTLNHTHKHTTAPNPCSLTTTVTYITFPRYVLAPVWCACLSVGISRWVLLLLAHQVHYFISLGIKSALLFLWGMDLVTDAIPAVIFYTRM